VASSLPNAAMLYTATTVKEQGPLATATRTHTRIRTATSFSKCLRPSLDVWLQGKVQSIFGAGSAALMLHS
jgi:hypothetical protein